MTRRHMSERLLRAMREELERRTAEEADRIFGGPLASGPRPSFKERDFGRWADKVRGAPGGDAADAFAAWTAAMDAGVRANHAGARADGGWTHYELPPEFLAESPSRSDSSSFKESFRDAGVIYGGTPCEAFAKRGSRSLFLSRAYLAVSEEPGVAVAAVQLRAAFAAEALAVERAPSGIQTHSDEAVLSVVAAEAKLRRRIKAALIADTPSAEPSLW